MGRKRKITGLDLRYLIRELSPLEGKIIRKIYMLEERVVSLVFYPGLEGRRELIVDLDGYVFLTDLKWPKPQTPPPFVMALRKHLEGRRIDGIDQFGIERIFRISAGGFNLIVELFGGGNVVLTKGEEIVLPYKRAEFRERSIRPGEIYRPPGGLGVELDPEDRQSILAALEMGLRDGVPLWKVLIGYLGMGPPYSDEVSRLIGLDLRSKLDEGSIDELADLAYSFLNGEARPTVYIGEGGEAVNFSAFPLSHLELPSIAVDTLSKAIQQYYLSGSRNEEKDPRIKSLEAEIARQESLKEEYRERAERYRHIGDLIYLHLSEVEGALKAARRGDTSPLIASVDRMAGKVVLNLDGEHVQLDLIRSATENASDYYSRAKKLKEKYERIDGAISSLRKKLEALRREAKERELAKAPVRRKRLRWYERFRWFYTSGGFLVIGGRDAQTNSKIVSKYLDSDDLFFHADIPGGSAVVLKLEGKEPDEESVQQAATAAGVFSRAWREGLSSIDVYYVRGHQVSRHAPPGMYLPKGGFYITGKRNYLRVRLQICVGFQETPDGIKLTAAPPGAPFLHSICLKPGSTGKEEAAKVLKNMLEAWLRENIKIRGGSEPLAEIVEVSVDDIVRALPPGKVAIVE